ncbi:MAG: DUF2339 domain-containing protein, partial [Pseudomonadota bacterium]
ICGLIAVSRMARFKQDLSLMQQRIDWLQRKVESAAIDPVGEAVPTNQPFRASEPLATDTVTDPLAPARASNDVQQPLQSPSEPAVARTSASAAPKPVVHKTRVTPRQPKAPSAFDQWIAHLQQHWMTWLGGGCVALAGIFMVRYSMDRGWLGPLARILFAIATGLALLGTAEYLRRRHGGTQPALAALAGAGSITLYGALLAAMRLYELIEPGTAFFLMAGVAVGTMALALVHGPILAAFGILGAYLVPILVSTGSGDIVIALVYALIVSLSALLLMRHVYRPWLWWGFVIGGMGWWLLSLDFAAAHGVRSLYLVALGYLIAAAPMGDWALRRSVPLSYQGYNPLALLKSLELPQRNALLTLVLLSLASGASIVVSAQSDAPWLSGLPFFGFSLWLARGRETVFVLPWLTLLVTVGAWLAVHVDVIGDRVGLRLLGAESANTFLTYAFVYASVAAIMSVWLFGSGRRQAIWASLATLGPMLLITLAYLLNVRPETNAFWGLVTAVLALAYLTLATSALRKNSVESLVVWLFIGGHFGLGIAAAIVFESASLTLAIAAQAVSLAWVIRKFELPNLGWLLKLVVVIVITRLTFNPWLTEYPVGVHWSLWTYGGSALLTAFAAYWLRPHPALSRWAEGAALHLLVLTIWSEVRYQLYDGAVYAAAFSFAEAVLTMGLSAAMALVYYHRASVSESLARLYRIYASVLAVASVAVYGLLLVRLLASDPWVYSEVGATPVFNVLIPTFGFPVVYGLLFSRWFDPRFHRLALRFAGFAAFVFVSLQVRHLWTASVRLNDPAIGSGELYTYSAVWLAIAIGALLVGSWRYGQGVYRAGLALLAIVIAKLFLIDMSGLDGLLRVASFMGLGLSLLGVAYLHQRLGGGKTEPVEQSA